MQSGDGGVIDHTMRDDERATAAHVAPDAATLAATLAVGPGVNASEHRATVGSGVHNSGSGSARRTKDNGSRLDIWLDSYAARTR